MSEKNFFAKASYKPDQYSFKRLADLLGSLLCRHQSLQASADLHGVSNQALHGKATQ